ncbi:MAG TPA: ion transporter [candidate division Zixibacteria bacterium]|nr:ion transporter [candidate division Zixibacteria bacterium]
MSDNKTESQIIDRAAAVNMTYELFIIFLSIYSIVVVILATIVPVKETTVEILIIVDHFIVVIFFYDFIRQLYKAPKKLAYLKWGWMDLVSSLPGVYYLRVLRIGRIVTARNKLRAATGRSVWEAFKQHRAESALLTTTFALFFLILFTSILVLSAEADAQGSDISTAEDAVWWSFVTLTTVGYGDEVPITTSGRLIGFVLMAGGILLVAVFTGYTASYFNPHSGKEVELIEELRSDLAEIKRLLAENQEKG